MGLQWGLQHDDILEGGLRQLAAAAEFKRTHDAQLSNHMLGFRVPGDSVAPDWLLNEGRSYSTAVYQQGLRTRTGGQGRGRGSGADGGDGGDGAGGRGRGRGRGGRGEAAPTQQ